MRTLRTLAALALGACLFLAEGCTTVYYQYPKAGMFQVATGKDTTISGAECDKGKKHGIQPWVLAYCLAHESTNLPYYYQRLISWKGSPPTHFVVQTDPLMTEFSDRRDWTNRLIRAGIMDKLLPDADKKDIDRTFARACAANVGFDTWLGCTEALFEKGYARYSWGHKPELNGDKLNIAGFAFHVSIDPDAQIVTITTTKRDLAGGVAIQMKTCNFDVSKVKWTLGGKEGAKKVGAFDWVDHDGNDLAKEATFEEIGDWPKREAQQRLEAFVAKCEIIPPEVVAKGIKYLGTPESVQE